MTDGTVLNSGIYGDQQNRSFLPVAGRINGEELYLAKAEDIAQPGRPLALSIAGSDLVICYGNFLTCLNAEDGSLRWNRSIRGNHIFQVTDQGILTLDQAAMYVPLGLDNKPGEETYLASVHEGTFLYSVVILADGSWAYVIEQYPMPMSDPEEEDLEEPATRFVRYHPEQMDVRWEFVMPPEPRGVAVTEDGVRVFMAYPNSLYVVPVEATTDGEVTRIEFEDIISLAADGQGNALVVDIVENVTQLKHVTPDGEVGWVVSFEQGQPSNQPPASSPEGYVYLVVGRDLHQIRDGEIIWTYPLPASVDDIAITVLADNSVLAAAGTALVHVSARGEEILTKWLDTPIGTRPIMDENGRVYFGADDGIHCLK